MTFALAFPNANYRVTITGEDARSWSVNAGQTASGFTINSNANLALTGPVHWTAVYDGETL